MAEEEVAELKPQRETLHTKLEDILLGFGRGLRSDNRRESGPATGGDEAASLRRRPPRDVFALRPDPGLEGRGESRLAPAKQGGYKDHRPSASSATASIRRFSSRAAAIACKRGAEDGRRRDAIHTSARHGRGDAGSPTTTEIEIKEIGYLQGDDAGPEAREAQARQQDRVGRPPLVQSAAPPKRSKSSARTKRKPAQELRPGDARCCVAESSSGERPAKSTRMPSRTSGETPDRQRANRSDRIRTYNFPAEPRDGTIASTTRSTSSTRSSSAILTRCSRLSRRTTRSSGSRQMGEDRSPGMSAAIPWDRRGRDA